MEAVLISPVCPFTPRDGHRLAVLSDVQGLLDNNIALGVIAFTYADDAGAERIEDMCPTVRIPVGGGGFVARFIRGLATGLPPTAERLYGSARQKLVRDAIKKWSPSIVVIDDASVAGYIQMIRSLLPKARIVLRSHNVMHDVRAEQLRKTHGSKRAAVAFDCKRYMEFEQTAVLSSDRHWAITDADAKRMTELYNRPANCLTVSVPMERYESIPSDQGQSNGFVHVGSLDFRRRTDLFHFLDKRWPRILKADKAASLTLAGELKGEPISGQNVTYTGRVKSDADVYGRSRFALNFQSSPGGVKLKTLTSLAAGRTLLSTQEGVEGIDISSGREFFDIDQFLERGDLQAVLNDVRATQSIADAGRNYVRAHHSRPAIKRQILNLLEEV